MLVMAGDISEASQLAKSLRQLGTMIMIERRNDHKPRLSKEEIDIRLAQGAAWGDFTECGPTTAHLFDVDGKGDPSQTSPRVQKALALCRKCHVLENCRDDAIAMEQAHWVRGGLTQPQLRDAIQARREGREIEWSEQSVEEPIELAPVLSMPQQRQMGNIAITHAVEQTDPVIESILHHDELTQELSNFRTKWRESIALPARRTRGSLRVLDGVFDTGEIPKFEEDEINEDQRTALGEIFTRIYRNDQPHQPLKLSKELEEFFLYTVIDGMDEFAAGKKAGGRDLKKAAHDFVGGNLGTIMLAERKEILRRAFHDLKTGDIPRMPTPDEVKYNSKLDATINFLSVYRLAGYPIPREDQFILPEKNIVIPASSAMPLLERARVDEESIDALKHATYEDLHRIGYGIADCFKRCDYSPQDAATYTSRCLFTLMGVENAKVRIIFQDKNDIQKIILTRPKMTNVFEIEGPAIRELIKKRSDNLSMAS